MSSPRITDDEVAALDLHDGRVELLEEIMATPVLDHVSDRNLSPAPHRRRWVAALAAAAAVAAIASAPAWLGDQEAGGGGREQRPARGVDIVSGDRAVLDSEGWAVENVHDHPEYGGGVGYSKGEQSLEVTWYPAEEYDSYVEDRQHINHPAVDPGTPVDLLGKESLLWPYSPTDHAVIRPVEDRFFLEVRGSGMDRAAFRALLGHLRLVDARGFEDSLPEGFVTDAERRSRTATSATPTYAAW